MNFSYHSAVWCWMLVEQSYIVLYTGSMPPVRFELLPVIGLLYSFEYDTIFLFIFFN